MRIIQLMHSHDCGGAERHLVALSQGLAARGHDVLFAGPADSWLRDTFARLGQPSVHLRMSGLLDLVSHWRLHGLVEGWGADIVHAHGVRASTYATVACAPAQRSLAISTAHSTGAVGHMKRCAHVIAVSHAVRWHLLAQGHMPQRTSVIHHGVLDHVGPGRSALRRQLGLDDDVFAVCSAGRFVRDKGQDTMVRALARCGPGTVLCFFGGADTGYGQEVRALARQDCRIRFMGFADDVPSMLPAFDAYLCASRREAFGLALAEAAAAGLPVIAPRVGGIPEVVLDGVNGLLVPPDDDEALAGAVERLRADRGLAAELGHAGRQRCEALFSTDRMLDATLEVYRRAHAAKRAGAGDPGSATRAAA